MNHQDTVANRDDATRNFKRGHPIPRRPLRAGVAQCNVTSMRILLLFTRRPRLASDRRDDAFAIPLV